MVEVKKEFQVRGMYCSSCESLIEKCVNKLEGIKHIKVDYVSGKGEVEFDSDKTSIDQIFNAIRERSYDCCENGFSKSRSPVAKSLGVIFAIIGILVVGYFVFRLIEGVPIPEISQNMGYGLLFLVGILTGFHCVSMCGGFVVGYTAKDAKEGKKAYKSHFKYGLGKVVSYTVIGAAFGLLGSIIIFTPMIRGVAGILAGLFLVIFGLSSLGFIPWLRKIRFKTPRFIGKFVNTESKKHKSPLVIGLLNGLLIACGPLQAMYVMAAGTGSILEGAKILLIFGVGTLPVMLGFGFLASFVSTKATHRILKISGVVVIILGLIMVNRGLALTGTGLDTNSLLASVSAKGDETTGNVVAMEGGYQVIRMDVTRYGWEPDKFVLKKDVPTKWIINGKEINGCNNAIQVPKLGLEFDIKKGEQIIEFTPDKEGVISWSCWMGMIPGTFVVSEDIDLSDSSQVQKQLDNVPQQQAGSCGGSCGSSTCGAKTGGSCGCGGRR